MATLTWLHLSDWHQDKDNINRDTVLNALRKDIQERHKINSDLQKIDFVFFTGDLASKGKEIEYSSAREKLLDPILLDLGLTVNEMFIIPGNHDIDRDKFKFLPPQLQKPFKTERQVQEWQSGKDELDALLKPFEAYATFVKGYGAQGFFPYGGHHIVEIDNKKIGIIGCNSALMCGRRKNTQRQVDDYGVLTVGEKQIYEPLRCIEHADVRIALIHHPFSWLSDFDGARIEERLEKSCHFILRGHQHLPRVHASNSTTGSSVTVSAGASYERRDSPDSRYVNGYNFVRYDLETGAGIVYFRRWNDTHDEWIADHNTYTDGKFPFVLPIASTVPLNSPVVPTTTAGAVSKGLSAETPGASAIALEVISDKYLKYVANRWVNLEAHGIMQTGKIMPVPLDEVYVSLSANRNTVRVKLRTGNEKDTRLNDNSSDTIQSPESSSLKAIPYLSPAHPEAQMEIVFLAQAMRENNHVVVLGDPGAGKTVLTRFLARHFALAFLNKEPRVTVTQSSTRSLTVDTSPPSKTDDYGSACLPILLRVADFAEALRGNSNLRLRDFLVHARGEAEISEQETTTLFDDAIKRGRALIILDGLDEVVEIATRVEIARRIDGLVTSIKGENRVLVTSRIVGYEAARLSTDFTEFTFRDMESEQIKRFVSRRMTAYERTEMPDLSESEIEHEAQHGIQDILDSIRVNEGVKRLAVNPLLLSILCLIHRAGKRLPERRVELYQMASKTLLEDWRPAQMGKNAPFVKMTEADRLLAPLADWMHEHAERGLIQKQKAHDLLCEFSAARRGVEKDAGVVQDEVNYFLERLCQHCGLLVERGHEEYAFLHLTFEEYWAARHLVSDFKEAHNRLRLRRHQARYQEVIRLAIASRSEEDADELIRSAIWSPEGKERHIRYVSGEYEDILHRDLILAARCISDCESVEPLLAKEIASELVKCLMSQQDSYSNGSLKNALLDVLSALKNSEVGTESIGLLLTLTEDKTANIRESAAQALGRVGTGNDEVLTRLLTLTKDKTAYVRGAAAQALGRVETGNDEVLTRLLTLTKDRSGNVRGMATQALGRVGTGNPQVLATLLPLINDKEHFVQFMTENALQMLFFNEPQVDTMLLAAVRDSDQTVRQKVALALGRIGNVTREMFTILSALSRDEVAEVRGSVALALGRVGTVTREMFTILFALSRDEVAEVRRSVAQALVLMGTGNPQALTALLTLTKDEDANVRQTATQALGSVGAGNDEVLTTLLVLTKDETANIRESAAQALGRVGTGNDEVLTRLLTLTKDKTANIRESAAQALGRVGTGNDEVLTRLLTLTKDKTAYVRGAAAQALGRVETGNDEVLTRLLTLTKDRSGNVRGMATQALGRVGTGNPQVLATLLILSKDKATNVRGAVAQTLGLMGTDNPQVLETLLTLTKERTHLESWIAIEALGRVGIGNVEVLTILLALTKDEDTSMHFIVARTIETVVLDTPDIVALLVETTKDKNVNTRSIAIDVLWTLMARRE